MKKIIFILICFFSSIYIIEAASLISEELPYYVKISKNGNEKVLRVKKIYDKDTLNVVFNIDYLNYDISNDFNIHGEYDKKIWKASNTNLFSSIVYYGYNNDKTDLSYFLTQVVIWKLINNANVTIVDEFGNETNDYSNWSYIFNKSINHSSKALFFTKEYNVDLWSTNKLKYDSGNLILDNPVNNNFGFKNNGKYLYIYAKEVGTYNLEFSKTYEQELYCYEDGNNVYWQSLKGPANVLFTLKYNVLGTKLNIKENLVGVNNRVGDAKLDSVYEVYLDNELKRIINSFDNVILRKNSNYILKDISNNLDVKNVDDINLEIKEKEYLLEIEKQVISKNISLDIKNDNKYYIYLKSNNELYEVVNQDTDLITLPYGLYFIKDDNDYYQELEVYDTTDELLIIEENDIEIDANEEKETIKDQEIVEENTFSKEEIKDNELEEEILIENEEVSNENNIANSIIDEIGDSKNNNQVNIDNPMTYDNSYDSLMCWFLSMFFFFFCYFKLIKCIHYLF